MGCLSNTPVHKQNSSKITNAANIYHFPVNHSSPEQPVRRVPVEDSPPNQKQYKVPKFTVDPFYKNLMFENVQTSSSTNNPESIIPISEKRLCPDSAMIK